MRTWTVQRPQPWSLPDEMFMWSTIQVVDDRGNPQSTRWMYARALLNPEHARQYGWPCVQAIVMECELALDERMAAS